MPTDLVNTWAARDPIAQYRERLVRDSVASGADLDDIDRMTKASADDESQLAAEAPAPDPGTVERGLFGGDDFVPATVEIVRRPFAPEPRAAADGRGHVPRRHP